MFCWYFDRLGQIYSFSIHNSWYTNIQFHQNRWSKRAASLTEDTHIFDLIIASHLVLYKMCRSIACQFLCQYFDHQGQMSCFLVLTGGVLMQSPVRTFINSWKNGHTSLKIAPFEDQRTKWWLTLCRLIFWYFDNPC